MPKSENYPFGEDDVCLANAISYLAAKSTDFKIMAKAIDITKSMKHTTSSAVTALTVTRRR